MTRRRVVVDGARSPALPFDVGVRVAGREVPDKPKRGTLHDWRAGREVHESERQIVLEQRTSAGVVRGRAARRISEFVTDIDQVQREPRLSVSGQAGFAPEARILRSQLRHTRAYRQW